jgi:hypothetical protein
VVGRSRPPRPHKTRACRTLHSGIETYYQNEAAHSRLSRISLLKPGETYSRWHDFDRKFILIAALVMEKVQGPGSS